MTVAAGVLLLASACGKTPCRGLHPVYGPEAPSMVPFPSDSLLQNTQVLTLPVNAGALYPQPFTVRAAGFSPMVLPVFLLENGAVDLSFIEALSPEETLFADSPVFLIESVSWERVPVEVRVFRKNVLGMPARSGITVLLRPLVPLESSVTYIAGLLQEEGQLCQSPEYKNDSNVTVLVGEAESRGIIHGKVAVATSFTVRPREEITGFLWNEAQRLTSAPQAFTDYVIHCTGPRLPHQWCRDEISGGKIIHGYFLSTDYAYPFVPTAHIRFTDSSHARPYERPLSVPFVAVVPPSDDLPPVVIFQHGFSDSKEAMFRELAYTFAVSGLATVGIDHVFHGERRVGEVHLDYAAINSIEGTVDILALRDHMIQTVVDQMHLHALITKNNGDLDFDGIADVDSSRIYYIGQSLGGMAGAVFSGTVRPLESAVLNVAGGSISRLFEYFVYLAPFFPAYLNAYDVNEKYLIINFVQMLMDPVDPAAYAGEILHSRSLKPAGLLLQKAMLDILMPSDATYFLARAAGVHLIEPVQEQVPFLSVLSPPVSGMEGGLYQFPGATHGFLLMPDSPEPWKAAQMQAAHFFLTGEIAGVTQ